MSAGRGLLVVLAATPWQGHQLYDQRLAAALAEHDDVLYVSPPRTVLGIGGGAREPDRGPDAGGLRVVEPPMLPMGTRRWLSATTGLAVLLTVLLALLRGRRRPTGVVQLRSYPLVPRVARVLPVVDVVLDDYVAGAELIGLTPRRSAAQLRARLRHASRVAVVSPVLRAVLLRSGVRAAVVPAGCEPAALELPEPAELAAVPARRAVFIGMLSDRIDFDQLHAVAEAGLEVVVVGGVQHGFTKQAALDALRAHPRVHLLGSREPAALLALLQHCDVGLIPYVLSDFNRASFPLKTLEYLAAGIPVVGSELPGLRWLDTPLVRCAGGAAELAALAVSTVDDPPGDRAACLAVAAEHTWAARADAVRTLLRTTPAHRP